MRKLLLIAGILTASYSFSQNYSYRFSGKIDPARSLKIEQDLTANTGFQNVKFKIKEESGELLFQYKETASGEEQNAFSPLMYVKSVLADNGLEPLEVVELAK